AGHGAYFKLTGCVSEVVRGRLRTLCAAGLTWFNGTAGTGLRSRDGRTQGGHGGMPAVPTQAPDHSITVTRRVIASTAAAGAARADWVPPGNGAMADGATPPATGAAGRPGRPVATIASAAGRVPLGPHEEVTFGRGHDVHLRIGHAPVDDDLVADVAGAIFVRDGRVLVANRSLQLAFDI